VIPRPHSDVEMILPQSSKGNFGGRSDAGESPAPAPKKSKSG
jgi:hypothetical protein